MAAPIVFADANVLYVSALRDLLLQLAEQSIIAIRWSDTVQDEWTRALLHARPDLAAPLARTRQLMEDTFPEARVTGYEPLIDTLTLPDPDDRHVLAAAIAAGAKVILTFNLKDFPSDPANVAQPVAVHPDNFLLLLAAATPERFRQAVASILERLRNPPQSPHQYCATLAHVRLPRLAALLLPLLTAP